MLAALCHEPPVVIAKDTHDDMPSNLNGLVLSPGPGRPPHDTGISLDLIRKYPDLPILGVCLGHQALGYVYGAKVTEAPGGPIHGQIHSIVHDGEGLWKGVSSPLSVVRYHSLVVEKWDSPDIPLISTAWRGDILMGLQHKHNPHYGVQFHPESIGTSEGFKLITNFCEICETYKRTRRDADTRVMPLSFSRTNGEERNGKSKPLLLSQTNVKERNGKSEPLSLSQTNGEARNEKSEEHNSIHSTSMQKLQLLCLKVNAKATPSDVYSTLYASANHSVWLDSSNSYEGGEMARFSIMASLDGPLSRRIEYNGTKHVLVYDGRGKLQSILDTDILTYLQQDMASMQVVGDDETLPFDYRGGYLGYLGYEVRHDTQRALEELEHGRVHESKPLAVTKVPTAAFLFADQSLVYDHWEEKWYMIGLAAADDTESVVGWMDRVKTTILDMRPNDEPLSEILPSQQPLAFVPNRSPETYRENIAICHEQIRLGESYELCLTNQLEATVIGEQTPLQLYKILRRRNPAPFAAFLNFQGNGRSALSVCCSSPERFVSVKKRPSSDKDAIKQHQDSNTNLHVEAKPIKGTCARQITPNGRARTTAQWKEDARRAQELETSVKNRAENLMIVDLLRNDLNRVCEVGSVHVPKLMQIESYATVHQMVSTIRGQLNPSKTNVIDVLRACFPGGSMTGAPKRRTMEILDDLEEGVARGPYSGCLGYISLNGCMDMNIVIRSAVLTPEQDGWRVTIGAGGAITALSESDDEYEEMLLKARAVVEAVQMWADISPETGKNTIANMTSARVTA
jgi:para-aminobenzoate synthetase